MAGELGAIAGVDVELLVAIAVAVLGAVDAWLAREQRRERRALVDVKRRVEADRRLDDP